MERFVERTEYKTSSDPLWVSAIVATLTFGLVQSTPDKYVVERHISYKEMWEINSCQPDKKLNYRKTDEWVGEWRKSDKSKEGLSGFRTPWGQSLDKIPGEVTVSGEVRLGDKTKPTPDPHMPDYSDLEKEGVPQYEEDKTDEPSITPELTEQHVSSSNDTSTGERTSASLEALMGKDNQYYLRFKQGGWASGFQKISVNEVWSGKVLKNLASSPYTGNTEGARFVDPSKSYYVESIEWHTFGGRDTNEVDLGTEKVTGTFGYLRLLLKEVE